MLTANQEQFCQNIIQGMSQADAYRLAYPNCRASDETVWVKASQLAAQDKVKIRLAELRESLAKPSIMTAQERLEWLTKVINNDEQSMTDRLRAVDIANKMTGEYVQRVSAEVTNAVNIHIELSDD